MTLVLTVIEQGISFSPASQSDWIWSPSLKDTEESRNAASAHTTWDSRRATSVISHLETERHATVKRRKGSNIQEPNHAKLRKESSTVRIEYRH